MPSLTEPYEDPVDISYKQTPQGVVRVRSVSVKPYRRHELRLLAEGIPIVYFGNTKGHARSETATSEDQTKASQLQQRPLWAANQTGKGRTLSPMPWRKRYDYDGVYVGNSRTADVLARKYGINVAGDKK